MDRPYEGEYLQSDDARKGLLDAKKRAKDSSRIVFSDEQTVAQLVQGCVVTKLRGRRRVDGVDVHAGPGRRER